MEESKKLIEEKIKSSIAEINEATSKKDNINNSNISTVWKIFSKFCGEERERNKIIAEKTKILMEKEIELREIIKKIKLDQRDLIKLQVEIKERTSIESYPIAFPISIFCFERATVLSAPQSPFGNSRPQSPFGNSRVSISSGEIDAHGDKDHR